MLIAIYLVIKLTILFFGTEEIYSGDEIYYGAIAKELITGPILPFFDYQPSEQNGGWFIMPFLIAPFFLIFGPSYLSLKLASLIFPLATLILLCLFLNKFFNRRVAIISSLLLILAPPGYTKLSFMPLGTHIESILFTLSAVYIFYNIFFSVGKKINFNSIPKLYFILFGLISGFGSFFCYTFIITLVALLIIVIIVNKKALLTREFLLFITFFLLGFSPWLYNNIFCLHFGGIDIVEKAFSKPPDLTFNISQFFRRISLLPEMILKSMYFKDVAFLNKNLFSFIYFIIFLLSYFALALTTFIQKYSKNTENNAKKLFFLVYPLIFIFIFIFSNFDLNKFRYLMPIYPFTFIIIALFIDMLFKKDTDYRYLAVLIIFFLLITGIIGDISLFSHNTFKKISRYAGFRYHLLGYPLVKRYGFATENYLNSIEKLNNMEKRDIYRKISEELCDKLKPTDINTWLNYISKIPHSYKKYFYAELGKKLTKLYDQNPNAIIFLITHTEEKYKPFLYQGIVEIAVKESSGDINKSIGFAHSIDRSYNFDPAGFWYININNQFPDDDLHSGNIKKLIILLENAPEQYKPYIYRKMGELFGIDFLDDFSVTLKNLDINKIITTISLFPKKYRIYLYEGFGEGIMDNYNEFLALDLADQIPSKYRPYVYRGIGKAFVWIYGEDMYIILKRIDTQMDIQYKPYLYEGTKLIN